MALVRMIVGISGTRNGQDWPKRGETLTVSQSEADDLVFARLAVAVEAVEAAVPPAPETAALSKAPTKRAGRKTS